MTIKRASDWWDLVHRNQREWGVEGLIIASRYQSNGRPNEEVAMMERAQQYQARAVFFGLEQPGRPAVAQAFVYDGSLNDEEFAKLHKRLWSWGGVPLVYRHVGGVLQLYRCAAEPDFVDESGQLVCSPVSVLKTASQVALSLEQEPWWDPGRLRNGTLWSDAGTCKKLLSANKAAHKALVEAVRHLSEELDAETILPKPLRRRLLILCLLIAYLEHRDVFPSGYFSKFEQGAERFFQVLRSGGALLSLLTDLEHRFNGHVFSLKSAEKELLANTSRQLQRFSALVEGRSERSGQLTLWQLYSFGDLPVELISHIYQLFVEDASSSVYTPPFLVRLVVDETLSVERIEQLHREQSVIVDVACGSGVFLVEAYKRLILHWRATHQWKDPDPATLTRLLLKVHGVDREEGAVDLAAFSLCLVLCDALDPKIIWKTDRLFPELKGNTLHHSCFFEARERGLLRAPVGLVLGNPPFVARLTTKGAERAFARYCAKYGKLPDRQLALLFLHESMELLQDGGVLGMLQNSNFLYNQGTLGFRRQFLKRWDTREILDFVSVRGLFEGADTKVLVIVAMAAPPKNDDLLHATFRRTGLVSAERGFDIDHYDLHWVPRELALRADHVWRCNLLGGGRLVHLIERLRRYPTLGNFAAARNWEYGEGFIEAKPRPGNESKASKLMPAPHLTGESLLTPDTLNNDLIELTGVGKVTAELFKSPYTPARYTGPMTLVRQQFDLNHGYLADGYATYKNQIVGFCGPKKDASLVKKVHTYLRANKRALQAFVAATSIKLFTQHSTTLSAADVIALPFPKTGSLEITPNEQIVLDDVTSYYRDLVRYADKSSAYQPVSKDRLERFSDTFVNQVGGVYRSPALVVLETRRWEGLVCQCYSFGNARINWEGDEQLKDRLHLLLGTRKGASLRVTRICVLYDESFVFLLKPDRTRYWMDSIALADADMVVADLRNQGF